MATLRWRWKSKKLIYQNIVRYVPGIGMSTFVKAQELGIVAKIKLAPHTANNAARRLREGKHASYIDVTRGSRKVDAFIELHDPDNRAIQIEAKLNILRGSIF